MVYRARSTNENGEGDGRVVPVSNEDRDRSSDLRKDANNPRDSYDHFVFL